MLRVLSIPIAISVIVVSLAREADKTFKGKIIGWVCILAFIVLLYLFATYHPDAYRLIPLGCVIFAPSLLVASFMVDRLNL